MIESNVDKLIERAERDASPDCFGPSANDTGTEKADGHGQITRTSTVSSATTSSSEASDIERDAAISRVPTQRDTGAELERHETASTLR